MNNRSALTYRIQQTLLGLAASALLAGCYVEVGPDHPDDISDPPPSVSRYSTEFLTRAALLAPSLAAESIEMVADPQGFLQPRQRSQSRSLDPIETTWTELFDTAPCRYSGTTTLDATGETETYADDMIWVRISAGVLADRCRTDTWLGVATIDSRLNYDVTGWYDEFRRAITSLDGELTGRFRITGSHRDISLSQIDSRIVELSSRTFDIRTRADLWLDNGWLSRNASLSTPSAVHWYRGDAFPYRGRMRISDRNGWVELTFSDSGVSRDDSRGYREYLSWRSLQ
jgi:hypothetical protein